MGWLGTSLGVGGNWQEIACRMVGFERLCWVVWEGDLVFSTGRGFVKKGGKDEYCMKTTFFIKLAFKKKKPIVGELR